MQRDLRVYVLQVVQVIGNPWWFRKERIVEWLDKREFYREEEIERNRGYGR